MLFKRYTPMKKMLSFLVLPLLLLVACGLNQQVKQLKAFEECKYELVSADSVSLANVDVSRFISGKGFDFSRVPSLAFAFLKQDLPLKGILNLQIKNPGANTAAVNSLKYQVFLKDMELTNGLLDKPISINGNGGMVTVPVRINSNIYSFISDSKNLNSLHDFLSSKAEKKTTLTFKLTPGVELAGKVSYPKSINLTKEVTNKMVLAFINKLK